MENLINGFFDRNWLNVHNQLIQREKSIDNDIKGVVTFYHLTSNTSFNYRRKLKNIKKSRNYIITLWAKTSDSNWNIHIELKDNKNNKIVTDKKHIPNYNRWINVSWNINNISLTDVYTFSIRCEASTNSKKNHSLYDPILFELKTELKTELKSDEKKRTSYTVSIEKNNSHIGFGFFITKKGHVITTANISENDTIHIILYPGFKKIKGKFIGKDKLYNISIIKIDYENNLLSFEEENIETSDVKIFNCFELINCKMIKTENKFYNQYPSFIIESKVILEKTIGCPVINAYDKIYGIVSFNKKIENYNLYNIINSNIILKCIDKIMNNKTNSYGYIGVCYKSINNKKYNIIISVEKKSIAETSGLMVGDLIYKINNIRIIDSDNLFNMIYFSENNSVLLFDIYRKNKSLRIIVPIEIKTKAYSNYLTFDNSDIVYC